MPQQNLENVFNNAMRHAFEGRLSEIELFFISKGMVKRFYLAKRQGWLESCLV